jgi:CubicO group peptidase (beta-lactamase class C family)
MNRALVLAALSFAILQAACAHAPVDPAPTRRWTTVAPAEVGLDAGTLAALDAEITSGAFGPVDGMLVVGRGRIAYERSYPRDYDALIGERARHPGTLSLHDPAGPNNYLNTWWYPYYHRGELHTLQSITKTVVSITIGVALARGDFPDLDTPILRYFDEGKVAHLDARKRRITIRHLLTMTAGLEWHEDLPFTDPANSANAMEASFDWAQYTIDRPMQHEPGTVFHYSSGAAQLLGHVFQRATGADVEEYAARYLFAPLGIDRFHWKRTPTGQADCEGGLYLRARDLAKLGLLFARNGAWEGRQLVTPEWVKASVAPAATASAASGVKYGYLWWLFPYADGSRFAWCALGWGGQTLVVVPERDVVAVFTGWEILDEPPRLRPRIVVERLARALAKERPR